MPLLYTRFLGVRAWQVTPTAARRSNVSGILAGPRDAVGTIVPCDDPSGWTASALVMFLGLPLSDRLWDNPDRQEGRTHAETKLVKLIEKAKANSIEPILTTEVAILPAGLSDQVVAVFLSFFGRASYDDRQQPNAPSSPAPGFSACARGFVLPSVTAVRAARWRHLTGEAYALITAQSDSTLRTGLQR